MADPEPPARTSIWAPFATAAAAVSRVAGLGLVLIAATLGRCDAFGGSCPAERPPLWDDDVSGSATAGAALVLTPLAVRLWRSGRHPLTLAGAVVAGAVVVGLLVRGTG